MSADTQDWDDFKDYAWRRPAPLARRAAMTLYSWQEPGWVFLWAMGAAIPFVLASIFAPALLSLSPTVEMLAPIAEARAIGGGEISPLDNSAPFYVFLLLAADVFADAPGRVHLLAKAFSAFFVVYPMAYFVSSRLPVMPAVLLTGALAAYVTAPFAGPTEFALALFLVAALSFVSASADRAAWRARFEGAVAGGVTFILWMLSPVFSLAAFVALSACPFFPAVAVYRDMPPRLVFSQFALA